MTKVILMISINKITECSTATVLLWFGAQLSVLLPVAFCLAFGPAQSILEWPPEHISPILDFHETFYTDLSRVNVYVKALMFLIVTVRHLKTYSYRFSQVIFLDFRVGFWDWTNHSLAKPNKTPKLFLANWLLILTCRSANFT